jgi:RHS repeat-associated protein
VRNSGSGADLEDTRTLSFTVSSGSGAQRHFWRSTTGVALALFQRLHRLEPPPPVTLAVRMRTHDDAGSGLVRYSFYSPEMNLMAETEPSTSATQTAAYEYVWFAGAPVAQIDTATSTTHWTFTDHLGTPQIQTNAAGAVDWRAEYEPYGSVFAYRSGATRHQPLRLPGQEYDEAVPGREYNILRWYASGWGRYTQADPLGLAASLNAYRYAQADPIRLIDANGLRACTSEQVKSCRRGCAALGKKFLGCTAFTTDLCLVEVDWVSCDCEKSKCPPCPPRIPRVDFVPPSAPHWPCPGTHMHFWTSHQNPETCACNYSEYFICLKDLNPFR